MLPRCSSRSRLAYTLTELLVVIALMLVIAALAAAFLPRLSKSYYTTEAAGRLQSWLQGARLRAKRDGLPTGIRIYPDAASPGTATSVSLIQQLPQITGDTNARKLLSYDPLTCIATFDPASIDFSLGGNTDRSQWLVQPGDWLNLFDGGPRSIVAVGRNSVELDHTVVNGRPNLYNRMLTVAAPTGDYSIFRQARLCPGEPPLELPRNNVIDLATMKAWGVNLPPGPQGAFDLLFAPSGELIHANLGRVILWVRDADVAPDTAPPVSNVGGQSLVVITIHTGQVSVVDVSPGTHPFAFN